jgi:polysaccharide export outer membrane protein
VSRKTVKRLADNQKWRRGRDPEAACAGSAAASPGRHGAHVVRFLIIVLAVLAPLLAMAPAAQGAGAPLLMPGDRIVVAVFGQPELSGTFQVDDTGQVELPLIGSVGVGQLDVKQCEKLIEARLADGFILRPVVSVRLSEPRPVYVLGDVRSPGAFPFRHGSIVLAAIAQAGGYGRSQETLGAGAMPEMILAEERVRLLERNERSLSVRKARLEAQRAGKATFELPVEMGGQAKPDKALAEVIAAEQESLRIEAAALADELALLRQQKPRLEAAHAAIEKQIEAERSQVGLIEEQLKDQETLQSKGLSRRRNQIALEREQAVASSNISRYRSELARLMVMIGETDIKIQDAQVSYRRRALTELEAVRAKLQEIEVTLPMARDIREARREQAGVAAGAENARPSYVVNVRRKAGKDVRTFRVGEDEALEPGDVVMVERVTARPEASLDRPLGAAPAQGSKAKTGRADSVQGETAPARRIVK